MHLTEVPPCGLAVQALRVSGQFVFSRNISKSVPSVLVASSGLSIPVLFVPGRLLSLSPPPPSSPPPYAQELHPLSVFWKILIVVGVAPILTLSAGVRHNMATAVKARRLVTMRACDGDPLSPTSQP